MLLKTNEGVLLVHICQRSRARSTNLLLVNNVVKLSCEVWGFFLAHTLQLFIFGEGGVVQQVLLGLRPGGAIGDIGHVVQNVLQSFPVSLSELLGLLLETKVTTASAFGKILYCTQISDRYRSSR